MFRIKELRNEQNLTQKELAQRIHSTDKNIWAYENKIAIPPLETLIKLADFFNCSLDYLVGRSDDFGNVNIIKSVEQLPDNEKNLIFHYEKLPPDLQKRLHSYLKKLLEVANMEN